MSKRPKTALREGPAGCRRARRSPEPEADARDRRTRPPADSPPAFRFARRSRSPTRQSAPGVTGFHRLRVRPVTPPLRRRQPRPRPPPGGRRPALPASRPTHLPRRARVSARWRTSTMPYGPLVGAPGAARRAASRPCSVSTGRDSGPGRSDSPFIGSVGTEEVPLRQRRGSESGRGGGNGPLRDLAERRRRGEKSRAETGASGDRKEPEARSRSDRGAAGPGAPRGSGIGRGGGGRYDSALRPPDAPGPEARRPPTPWTS